MYFPNLSEATFADYKIKAEHTPLNVRLATEEFAVWLTIWKVLSSLFSG